MAFWLEFLPIIIYFLLIIFLCIGIILGIKLIITLDKVDKVVEDVNKKVKSLNGFFHIIDYTTDKLALVTDVLVDKVASIFNKLVFKKRKKKVSDKNE